MYTVPPADSLLYQRGSEILGYDVRTGEFLPEQNAPRSALLELFPPQPLEVNSICLLTRGDNDTHYRLHREFQFNR